MLTRAEATERRRVWAGPSLFSDGFRPFFLFGALHAALMMALWVPWYLGFIRLPSAFAPVVWHSHELLFGYVPAIVAGFLLTAVPGWTGRRPIVGWPLVGLLALWLLGRGAIALSSRYPPAVVAAFSLAFPVTLFAVIAREILASRNWRNLPVTGAVCTLALAQAIFHYEIWRYGRSTYGDHLAVAVTLVLITIIGGRNVPSFTTIWPKWNSRCALSTSADAFDLIPAVFGFAALLAWISAPSFPANHAVMAGLLIAAGLLLAMRQVRRRPPRMLAEPLVAMLHIGFAFVPLGFVLAGYAMWTEERSAATAATHAWMVGATGLVTLAVMTRVTRGNTGRALIMPFGTVLIHALMFTAAAARITAALFPETAFIGLSLAGAAWIVAFTLFASFYGSMLLRPAMPA